MFRATPGIDKRCDRRLIPSKVTSLWTNCESGLTRGPNVAKALSGSEDWRIAEHVLQNSPYSDEEKSRCENRLSGFSSTGPSRISKQNGGGGDWGRPGYQRDGPPGPPWGVYERAKVVVLPSVERVHILGGPLHHLDVAGIRLPLLPESRQRSWNQTTRTEQGGGKRSRCGGRWWQRDRIHDRSERLGWRVNLWAVYHRKDIGEYYVLCLLPFWKINVHNVALKRKGCDCCEKCDESFIFPCKKL